MSSYCDAADVQFLLGFENAFSDSPATLPTLTKVNEAIADITNEIDFTLKSVGITVPPTDPLLLSRLKIGCKKGVACEVGMSGFGNNDSVADSQPNSYCKDYKDLLKDINNNPDNYGAVTGDENTFISNQVLDGTTSESAQNDNYIPNDFEV